MRKPRFNWLQTATNMKLPSRHSRKLLGVGTRSGRLLATYVMHLQRTTALRQMLIPMAEIPRLGRGALGLYKEQSLDIREHCFHSLRERRCSLYSLFSSSCYSCTNTQHSPARKFVYLLRIARLKRISSPSSRNEEQARKFQTPLASSTSARMMTMYRT